MRKSTFIGFEPSNTTAVPDILFDELLSELSGAELKVLLYIIRRTIGFKKSTDAISFSQFEDGIKTHEGKVLDKGCGLNRETISKALKSLESRHCIKSEKRAGSVTFYSICFKGDVVSEDADQQTSRKNQPDQSKKPTSQLVGKSVMTSRKNSISLVGKSDPQLHSITTTQNTNIQREREVTSPEENHSFTPSELLLLKWIEEKNINVAKDETKVKSQLEKLAPLAKTKAELQSLIEMARQLYLNINDLSLGNLVNKRVINAHAQQEGRNIANQPADGQEGAVTGEEDEWVLWTDNTTRAFGGGGFDPHCFHRMRKSEAIKHGYGSIELAADEIDQIEQAQRELIAMEG